MSEQRNDMGSRTADVSDHAHISRLHRSAGHILVDVGVFTRA